MSQSTYPFNRREYAATVSAEPSGPWANTWCDNREEYDQARQMRTADRAARLMKAQVASFGGLEAGGANV
jgi:hypothetical protein